MTFWAGSDDGDARVALLQPTMTRDTPSMLYIYRVGQKKGEGVGVGVVLGVVSRRLRLAGCISRPLGSSSPGSKATAQVALRGPLLQQSSGTTLPITGTVGMDGHRRTAEGNAARRDTLGLLQWKSAIRRPCFVRSGLSAPSTPD